MGGREVAAQHVRAAQAASQEAGAASSAVAEPEGPFMMYFGKYSKKPDGPLTIRQIHAKQPDDFAILCLQGVFKNRVLLVQELEREGLLEQVRSQAEELKRPRAEAVIAKEQAGASMSMHPEVRQVHKRDVEDAVTFLEESVAVDPPPRRLQRNGAARLPQARCLNRSDKVVSMEAERRLIRR